MFGKKNDKIGRLFKWRKCEAPYSIVNITSTNQFDQKLLFNRPGVAGAVL